MDPMEDHFPEGVGEPGPEDRANGAALLAAALMREAQALAQTAAGIHAVLDLLPMDGLGPDAKDRRVMRDSSAQSGALASALLFAARCVLRHPEDPAAAARDVAQRLQHGTLTPDEVAGLLRAAALAPLTDDAGARIAAASIAQTFWAELHSAWQRHS